ncbi:MAG TPA: hypothetical protein VF590_02670 [Isosphaeraceae bacterium]|jgi:hypothetical protein
MTRSTRTTAAWTLAWLALLAGGILAAAAPDDEPWLHPDTGPSRADVDATTLDGKALGGYQGWFNTPGDGTPFGFTHWGRGLDRPGGGHFTVDLWPDVSEYAPEDLCDVPGVSMPDGSPARLYSAYRPGPVLPHFRWMRPYGIDGVFLSRAAAGSLVDPAPEGGILLAAVRDFPRAGDPRRLRRHVRRGRRRHGDLQGGQRHPGRE